MSHETYFSTLNMDEGTYDPQEGEDIFDQSEYSAELTSQELIKINAESLVAVVEKRSRKGLLLKYIVPVVGVISLVSVACGGGKGETHSTQAFGTLEPATPTEVVGSAISTPTIENKVTPPPTATATETSIITPTETTSTPEGFSPTGKYANLEDFVEHNTTTTREEKEAIQELTQDSDYAFGNDKFMVVIQKSLKTRTKSSDVAGNPWAVDQLHSAELTNSTVTVDGKEYSSVDAMQMAIDTAKYDAYKQKTGDSSLTLDDYLANKNLSFPLRAWDGVSGNYLVEGSPNAVVKSGSFVIVKLEGTQADDRLQSAIGQSNSYTTAAEGDVVVVGDFSTNISGVGTSFKINGETLDIQKTQTAVSISASLAGLSESISPDLQNQMVFLDGGQNALRTKIARELWPFMITQQDDKGNLINSIIHVTGTPQKLTP